MLGTTTPTPVVDKNGKNTTVHKRTDARVSNAGRAHNVRVPQSATNISDATDMVDNALALANEAIQRRDAVLERINLYKNSDGQLDIHDPELIEVIRVSEVANEIRNSIERLRGLEIDEKAVQRYIGNTIGGSLDGIEFNDKDDVETFTQKKALRNFYRAAFLALEGISLDDKTPKDEYV